MEQINQVLIERYFAQELSAAERNEIELRVQQDAQFRQEMAAYKLAMESIKLAQRAELKERFRQRDKVLDRRNKDFNIGRRNNLWMLAAAAVIAVFIGWQFFTNPQQASDQANVNPQDTTGIVQNPPVQIDTVKKEESPKKAWEEETTPDRSAKSGQEIFAENFDAYKDDAMDPTSRGNEELTSVEKFQMQYWEGKYEDAVTTYNTLSESQQENDNFRFIYAVALMATKKTKVAAPILADIVQNGITPFKSESVYYLALCHLQNGNFDEAGNNLKAYLADPDAGQKEKARKILADMK